MNQMQKIRRLPRGLQSFEEIRRDGYIYVDKTDLVWQIANTIKNNFMSRPRRFGKSLLSDTLACYFEGKKELFEGLKIMELEQEWPKRQVFRFDFSGKNTAEELSRYLNTTLAKYEMIYPKNDTDINYDDRFLALMEKAYEKTGYGVAVLFDEYDSPLQHTLFDKEEHEKIVNVCRSFFPALKTASQYLKCLFITGITKFTQLSFFSTLNNVSILSSMPQYATVCGFTHQEIIDNFMPELEAMGKENGWTVAQTLDALKNMYDGYHFSKITTPETAVYNPFSLINALADKQIINYWASSGSSKLLNDMLKRADVDGDKLDGMVIDADTLQTADVTLDNVPLFLYQCGYLTIKDYEDELYILTIPNNEVRRALYKIVLPNALNKEENMVVGCVNRMKLALKQGDIEGCMKQLQQLISETPYAKKGEKSLEERYRFLIKNALYLAGCRIEEEKQVAGGIIDLVAHFRNGILVMELKLDNNGGLEAAKKQLAENNYAAAYSAEDKPVYAVAIELGSQERGIIAYDIVKAYPETK